eukprot:COSAG05_NODE_208_length_14084_cov_4.973671_6_plen_129_part_00
MQTTHTPHPLGWTMSLILCLHGGICSRHRASMWPSEPHRLEVGHYEKRTLESGCCHNNNNNNNNNNNSNNSRNHSGKRLERVIKSAQINQKARISTKRHPTTTYTNNSRFISSTCLYWDPTAEVGTSY